MSKRDWIKLAVIAAVLVCAVLLVLPVSEVVKRLTDAVLLRLTEPHFVPRLELKNGVPKAGKTLCVVSALLTNAEDLEGVECGVKE